MKLQRNDALALAVSAACALPQVLQALEPWAFDLALLGMGFGGGYLLVGAALARKAKSCVVPSVQQTVSVLRPLSSGVRPMNAHLHSGSHEHDLPCAPSGLTNSIWRTLWNTKHHGLVIAGASLWIVCPFDLDFIPLIGWFDDVMAGALVMKHTWALVVGDPIPALPAAPHPDVQEPN